jgi:hypothetical protein
MGRSSGRCHFALNGSMPRALLTMPFHLQLIAMHAVTVMPAETVSSRRVTRVAKESDTRWDLLNIKVHTARCARTARPLDLKVLASLTELRG